MAGTASQNQDQGEATDFPASVEVSKDPMEWIKSRVRFAS